MKKRLFITFTALLALAGLLTAGAYAAESSTAYAIFYEDGTLSFQRSGLAKNGRTLAKSYEFDMTTDYTEESLPPWHEVCASVLVADFADQFSPTSTAWWFYECSHMQSVENIENLDTSNVTNMRGMFCGCYALNALNVSNFDTAKVTNMSQMFSGCSKLRALDVSSFDTAEVTNMAMMFDDCLALEKLDVSNFNTSNVTAMSGMFDWCASLTRLDLSNFDTSKVIYMGFMFQNCSDLLEVNLSSFDTSNVTIMPYMFQDCVSLARLDLSSFNTAQVTNMDCMFSGCSNLRLIYASGRFQTFAATSSNRMFFECASLTGPNKLRFDSKYINKAYARVGSPFAPGYFTYKSPSLYGCDIAAAAADKDAGTLSAMLKNPEAVTIAVSYFNEKGKFMSVEFQSVEANTGTVTATLAEKAKTARVTLFDADWNPMCQRYEVEIG